MKQKDLFKLSPQLAAKIGSIIVHADEFTSLEAHPFDAQAIRDGLADLEEIQWLGGMQELALVPEKRNKGKSCHFNVYVT